MTAHPVLLLEQQLNQRCLRVLISADKYPSGCFDWTKILLLRSSQTTHQVVAIVVRSLPSWAPLVLQLAFQMPMEKEQCRRKRLFGRKPSNSVVQQAHPTKRWSTVSTSSRQKTYFSSPLQSLFRRLSTVKTLFFSTNHKKILTLGGVRIFHKRANLLLITPPSCKNK